MNMLKTSLGRLLHILVTFSTFQALNKDTLGGPILFLLLLGMWYPFHLPELSSISVYQLFMEVSVSSTFIEDAKYESS